MCGPLVGQLEHARFADREMEDLIDVEDARLASLLPLVTNIAAAVRIVWEWREEWRSQEISQAVAEEWTQEKNVFGNYTDTGGPTVSADRRRRPCGRCARDRCMECVPSPG